MTRHELEASLAAVVSGEIATAGQSNGGRHIFTGEEKKCAQTLEGLMKQKHSVVSETRCMPDWKSVPLLP